MQQEVSTKNTEMLPEAKTVRGLLVFQTRIQIEEFLHAEGWLDKMNTTMQEKVGSGVTQRQKAAQGSQIMLAAERFGGTGEARCFFNNTLHRTDCPRVAATFIGASLGSGAIVCVPAPYVLSFGKECHLVMPWCRVTAAVVSTRLQARPKRRLGTKAKAPAASPIRALIYVCAGTPGGGRTLNCRHGEKPKNLAWAWKQNFEDRGKLHIQAGRNRWTFIRRNSYA